MKTPPVASENGSDTSQEATWPSDWLRATLGMCALKSLEPGPSYGYAIITALEEAGLGTIKGGTLYPLLTRFETAGLLKTEWRAGEGGPGRKYFELTAAGQAALDEQRSAWARFAKTTNDYLNESDAGEQESKS